MVESPCIRQCCLDDNDVCCGCFRHISEITGWQTLTVDQQKIIIRRSELRKEGKAKEQAVDNPQNSSNKNDIIG